MKPSGRPKSPLKDSSDSVKPLTSSNNGNSRNFTRRTALLTTTSSGYSTASEDQDESEDYDISGEDPQSSDSSSVHILQSRKKRMSSGSRGSGSRNSGAVASRAKPFLTPDSANSSETTASTSKILKPASSAQSLASLSSLRHHSVSSSTKPSSHALRHQPFAISNVAPALIPSSHSEIPSHSTSVSAAENDSHGSIRSDATVHASAAKTVASNTSQPASRSSSQAQPLESVYTPTSSAAPSIVTTPATENPSSSLSSKKDSKKHTHETPSTNTVTVETETVSAVPTLAVAGVPGSSIKVKKSTDNVHNKSSHRNRKKKASRLGSHVPTKAEVFASKIASAVDEAQSSDSDETFVYEVNPTDQQQQRSASHITTPGGTVSGNATVNGAPSNNNNNVGNSNNQLNTNCPTIIAGNSGSNTQATNLSVPNASNSNTGSSSTVSGGHGSNSTATNPNTGGLQSNHANSSSISSLNSNGISDSYQNLAANSRRNLNMNQKNYQQQMGNLQQLQFQQQQQPQPPSLVNSPGQSQMAFSAGQTQPPMSQVQQTGPHGNQLHHQSSTYFSSGSTLTGSNSNNLDNGYFSSINKLSPPLIQGNMNSAVGLDGAPYITRSNSVSSESSPYAGESNISSNNGLSITPGMLALAAANSNIGSNPNSNSNTPNSTTNLNNTINSINSSNVGTISSTGTTRHLHPQSSITQLSQLAGNASMNGYNAAQVAQMQGLTGDPVKDDFKTLKKKPSYLRTVSSSSSSQRPDSPRRNLSSRSTTAISAASGMGPAPARGPNHANNLRHQPSLGYIVNHYPHNSAANERGGNIGSGGVPGVVNAQNASTSAANGSNNSSPNLLLYKQPGYGHNYRQGRWLPRHEDSEYVDEFYDEYEENSDNEEDDDEYLEYSETTPLRKGLHGVSGGFYTQNAGGQGGLHPLGSGGIRRMRGTYGNGFRAYSPHNYQRRSRNYSGYEKFRRIFWFIFGVIVILALGFVMGFVLATTKPLHQVNLSSVFDVLVSDEELVFDMAVEAVNPGYLNVDVYNLDLDVFARSPYVKGDPDKGDGDSGSSQYLETTSFANQPSNYAMLLGNIRHFEVPLVFDGSFFGHTLQRSIGQLKLVNPGLNSTLPNDGKDGDSGDPPKNDDGVPGNGRGDFDGDDDFGAPDKKPAAVEPIRGTFVGSPNVHEIQFTITTTIPLSIPTTLSLASDVSTAIENSDDTIKPVAQDSVSVLDSKKHLDNGQKRWAIVNTHPFELILRGVIKYQLALDRTPRVASITRTTQIDPNSTDDGNPGDGHKDVDDGNDDKKGDVVNSIDFVSN